MIRSATITALVALFVGVMLASCTSLDRDLQREIEAMAATIETQLDPSLPASFQSAAKRQARETVKYAETNDPLLRRNVTEMLDTIKHDLDPAIPEADRARLLQHAQAVKKWIDSDQRPAYFAETEPANEP